MLRKLAIRFSFDFLIFKKNLLWFFLSVFFFSRLFYVISRWNDLKHIESPIEFFIMNDYNFSLMGAIFGFFLVFFILLRIRKEKLDNFINGIVLSFLFVLPIGFFGSLLGGQVYGKETFYGIEIMYNHPFTPVPFKVPVFPLPIIYSILFFLLFSALYILSMYVKFKNILGYLGLMIFSCIIFIFEFFSGKYGIFKDTINLNLSQICAIAIFIFCFFNLKRIYKEDSKSKAIIN
ncbi:MAG: prolipoprotein diacylglyceryl transferase [Candidatus Gracilibacteria bacterium]|nr:prolipoprotein diacylglyceryl transferase [Candidatus Gracilibacteria bacterium]